MSSQSLGRSNIALQTAVLGGEDRQRLLAEWDPPGARRISSWSSS